MTVSHVCGKILGKNLTKESGGYDKIKDFQTKKCKMGGWYNSTPPDIIGDGCRYTITWSKVSGVDGYEVLSGGKDFDTGWFEDTTYTRKRSKSLEFSSLVQLRARVRPYMDVKGNRIYGKWSSYCYKSL